MPCTAFVQHSLTNRNIYNKNLPPLTEFCSHEPRFTYQQTSCGYHKCIEETDTKSVIKQWSLSTLCSGLQGKLFKQHGWNLVFTCIQCVRYSFQIIPCTCYCLSKFWQPLVTCMVKYTDLDSEIQFAPFSKCPCNHWSCVKKIWNKL